MKLSQAAFTLWELLIVLVIVALLMSMAAPSLHQIFLHTHDKILQQQLLNAIEFARVESRIQHLPITVCPSSDHLQCDNNWRRDFLIYINEEGDDYLHDRSQRLAVIQTQFNNGELHWRAYPRYRHFLQFSPDGLIENDNGTFWFCNNENASLLWAVTLSKSAKTRIIYPDSHGIIKDSHGKPLHC